MPLSLSLGLGLSSRNTGGGGPTLRFTTALPPEVTYSRTGAATALTVAGAVSSFLANAAQITDRGLLLEPAATNRAWPSQVFNDARWPVLNASVTANQVVAPDGTTTADAIIDNATSARHILYQDTGAFPSNSAGVFSVYLKQGTARYAHIQLSQASTYHGVVVDLQTGLVTSTATTGGLSGVTTLVEAAANGFWRVSVSYVLSTVPVATYLILAGSNAAVPTYDGNGNPTYVGTGLAFYAWQAGLQVGAVATSPIFTTSAAATRALPTATVVVPAGRTKARATYGLSNTIADVTGLTPGATFDLVTGRPWIGLGNELKTLEWRP